VAHILPLKGFKQFELETAAASKYEPARSFVPPIARAAWAKAYFKQTISP
jgi:hypothetical protein